MIQDGSYQSLMLCWNIQLILYIYPPNISSFLIIILQNMLPSIQYFSIKSSSSCDNSTGTIYKIDSSFLLESISLNWSKSLQIFYFYCSNSWISYYFVSFSIYPNLLRLVKVGDSVYSSIGRKCWFTIFSNLAISCLIESNESLNQFLRVLSCDIASGISSRNLRWSVQSRCNFTHRVQYELLIVQSYLKHRAEMGEP